MNHNQPENSLLNHQADHIISDVIIKTFNSSERLLLLLVSVNQKLAQKKQIYPQKIIYTNAYHFINFDFYFKNQSNDLTKIANDKKIKLTFFDKRDLKSSFKKAMREHQWELSKMKDNLSEQIFDQAWKYVETFIDISEYLAQTKD